MSNDLVLSEVMALGQALAESKFFSDAKEANQAVVKVLAGQELGIGPIAAMSGLYIIKGQVVLSANIMASLIKSNQKYDYQVVDHSNQTCTIEFFENGQSIGVSEFNMDDAKQAGLQNKDNWKSFPKNMLFARALSNGAKWFCSDLFNGQSAYTSDEIENEPDLGLVIESEYDLKPEIAETSDAMLPNDISNVSLEVLVHTLSGSPIEKANYINEKINDGELLFEKVTVKDIVDIENK